MSAITIRLDEKLEKLLNHELKLANRSRSDLVREALESYLADREQERLKQSIVQEMKSLPADAKAEGLTVAEDHLAFGNEAIELSEGPNSTNGKPWWK